MNSRPNCQARIRGDQYHCDRCGLVWDISDLDPPECQTVFNVGTSGYIDHDKPSQSNPEIEKKEVDKMREILNPECCRHGVPLNAECRSCDILDYKRGIKNQ